jgi:hypothetical protein
VVNAGTGSLSLTSSGLLTVDAAVTAGTNVALQGAGIALAAGVTGGLAGGDTVSLAATTGPISQSAGVITGATLIATSTGGTTLDDTNQVADLGASTNTGAGGFALVDGQPLTVTGVLTDTGTGQTVALTTKTGGITLGTSINAGNDTLDLVSAGSIVQTSGSIDVATLTGSAATSASLAQVTNLVGTLAAFTTTAGLTLTDNEALTVSGPVADSGIAQTVALTTRSGDITLTGAIDAPFDTLNLISAGSVNQTGGSIDVAILTGSVVNSATLMQVTNKVGTLATFLAGSSVGDSFALTDSTALTMTGTISAPLIIINTGTNALSMAAGTVIDTGGTTAPNHLTIARGELPVTPPTDGAYFTSGNFTQSGATQVNLLGGGPNSVLSLTAENGGNISFDPSAGLNGPTTWLVLNLAAAGSHVTGNVNVNQLTVVLPANVGNNTSPFSVALTGSVDGQHGQIAASDGSVIPTRGITLRINNCPIGSVNCVLLSGALVPVTNPLQNLTLGILVAPDDEGDLLLPLVSDEDFLSCLLRSNGSDPNDCN